MKKIIYIIYLPLSNKIRKDYFIDDLMERNIDVEYWDLSTIFFPKTYPPSDNLLPPSILFHSLKEVAQRLASENIDNCFFIPQVTYNFDSLPIFRLLSKYKCTTGIFVMGCIPTPIRMKDKPFFDKVKVIIRQPVRIISGLKNVYASYLKRKGFVKSCDYVFKAGTLWKPSIGIESESEAKNAKIIELNSIDYSTWQEKLNITNLINEPYCLFLDVYLPFHPDFEMLNIRVIDADTYYKKLNHFFDKIEQKYNLKVVVAAHPKAEKYKQHNYFAGRVVLFHQTIELVKFAQFVIAHGSTSIGYAVIENKPLLCITTTELKNEMKNHYHHITNYAKSLGLAAINIDDEKEEDLTIAPPTALYEDYKYKYMTSKETENKRSKDIFIDTITHL